MYLVINQMQPKMETPTLFDDLVFKVPVKRLGTKDYSNLREACKKLITRRLTLIDDPVKKTFKYVVPFYEVSYDGDGYIVVSMAKSVAPDFLDLKAGYTKYYLDNAMALTRRHSQRLYELLSRWKDIGIWTVEIDKFKHLLDIEGCYPATAELKRNVLDPAKDELYDKTELYFTYEFIKENRKPTAIIFHITGKAEFIRADCMEQVKNFNEAERISLFHHVARDYRFRKDQITKIITDPQLLEDFFDIHFRIVANPEIVKKDKTALVITHLKLK